MSKITLDKLCKSFGAVEVLNDIDLDIAEGEFIVFVGPSGCGKSTLLRQIAGLDKPTAGTIRIDGKTVNTIPAADRGLAMVFQSYALYPHMSVRQNLSFGLENAHVPKREIARRISDAARMLEISEYLDRKPGQLSGGQRQRVAIGRAIVRNPTAFLLDEPLSNLDAELRISTRAEIAALHARLKTTMIYVTHDQIEAMTLADRIVVLRAGRIEQIGTPLELYNAPANRFVAGFIGSPSMNFLPVEMVPGSGGRELVLPGGSVLPVDADIEEDAIVLTVGVRPQHMRLAAAGEPSLSAQVTLVEALGSETVVHARIGEINACLAVLAGQQYIEVGSTLELTFDRANLHLFAQNGRRIATAGAAKFVQAAAPSPL